MSQRHADLMCTAGVWSLVDLGAKNGTWINGARVGAEPASLRDGDLLQLGHTFSACAPSSRRS
jgi:pSer/pThr/pTyr-binding forkhead associated (FHA) protein